MLKLKIERCANMVFCSSDCGVIFKAWDESEFTERKMKNTMKKISDNVNGNVEFKIEL